MTVAQIAHLRILAADLGIDADQSARLIKARHPARLHSMLSCAAVLQQNTRRTVRSTCQQQSLPGKNLCPVAKIGSGTSG